MADWGTGFPDGQQKRVAKMHASFTSVTLDGTDYAFSVTWHNSSCGVALMLWL